MRIIYKNIDNSVGVLVATQEAINMVIITKTVDWGKPFTLVEALKIIAEKDVPAPYEYPTEWLTDEDGEENAIAWDSYNTPYWIVSVEDIPTDRTYRSSWEWDDSINPDGFGGESNEFDAELLAKYRGLK